MSAEIYPERSASVPRIADWVIRIIVALAFLAAGGAKLAGAPMMVEIFNHIGVGQWFRYVTAGCEIVGALLILAPRTAIYGAALLTCVMVGALFCHFVVLGGNPLPAAVLLLLNLVVLWLRRIELSRLIPAR